MDSSETLVAAARLRQPRQEPGPRKVVDDGRHDAGQAGGLAPSAEQRAGRTVDGRGELRGGEMAALCAERVTTYHVEDATRIDPDRGTIRHRSLATGAEEETSAWLPTDGTVRVGLTAGASTPNSKIGEAVIRILATRGLELPGVE